MLASKVWNAELEGENVGLWGWGFAIRGGMLDLRGDVLGQKRQNVGLEGMNMGFEQGRVGARGGMLGQGWNAGRRAECWTPGWNAGIETVNLSLGMLERTINGVLSSVGMLSCRGCPILWMIPCCLYERPPSRYNFLKIQSMFFSLILLSLWTPSSPLVWFSARAVHSSGASPPTAATPSTSSGVLFL